MTNKKTLIEPVKHKIGVLNPIFKLIPMHFIPKLAYKHGIDKQARSFISKDEIIVNTTEV